MAEKNFDSVVVEKGSLQYVGYTTRPLGVRIGEHFAIKVIPKSISHPIFSIIL